LILDQLYKEFIQRRPLVRSAFFFSILFLITISCSSTSDLATVNTQKVDYSLIFVVHADANYLYHENGKAKKADEEALVHAKEIAKAAKHGEVFIFHQKPERKAFLFFPKKDRQYYQYRNGVLIDKENYSPKNGGLTKESEIYKSHSANNPSHKTYFAYFGHEIPTFPGRTYHHSSVDAEFNSTIFADQVRNFSSDIALTILSTCNNGNPLMMNSLQEVTDVVIASPQNLHLSYLNADKFNLLESDPTIETMSLADSIAADSFAELSSLQTMVTVAIYDLDEISDYITSFNESYQEHLKFVEAKPLFTNNEDCNNIGDLESTLRTKGVTTFYKPAAFGRKARNSSHSGWGCKE